MRISAPPPVEPLLFDIESPGDARQQWCVYLFTLADCTAFKVGFSCSPLQRIYSFSLRFFERFDLSQSCLLSLPDCDAAREVEMLLKSTLSPARMSAPAWVPDVAGGFTEWFSAVHFTDAEARLQGLASVRSAGIATAFDVFHGQLVRVRPSFERWALGEAQRVCETWTAALRGYRVKDHSGALRNWLDAYRYFDVPLFVEDPQAFAIVRDSARLPLS